MGINYFDQILKELTKQKQLMEKLETENFELRQQIANLRGGKRIFVSISGIRFSLRDESSPDYLTGVMARTRN